jgi:hypothetical protein
MAIKVWPALVARMGRRVAQCITSQPSRSDHPGAQALTDRLTLSVAALLFGKPQGGIVLSNPFQGVTLVSGHRHTAGRKILHRRIKILNRGPPHIPAVVRFIVRPPAMHRASVVPDHQIAD